MSKVKSRANGEGGPYKKYKRKKDSNGTYYYDKNDYCYYFQRTIGKDENGNPIRKTVYGKTVKEARQNLDEFLKSLEETGKRSTEMTVGEWLDTWLEDYKKHKLKANTYASYLTNIKIHLKPSLGSICLKDLNLDHIQRLVNSLEEQGKSTALIRKVRDILHGAIKTAIVKKLIFQDPTFGLEMKEHTQKEKRILSVAEIKRFIAALGTNALSIAFKLALVTGMRMGEILALNWNDVDLQKGIIFVTKTVIVKRDFDPAAVKKTKVVIQYSPKTKASIREIEISKSAIEILKTYKKCQEDDIRLAGDLYQNNNLVFCTKFGTLYNPRNVIRSFKTILKKAGIEGATPHSLRHTFATRLFEQKDVQPKTVSVLMGHSKLAHTLDIYTHVQSNIKRKAVKSLDYLLQ